jgi:hypothetical protein
MRSTPQPRPPTRGPESPARAGGLAVITIRFVEHPGLFDRLCKFAQYGFWADHCDAVLTGGLLLGSRFAGGVQIRAADYDVRDIAQEIRISLKVTPEQEAAFYAFLRDQVGKPYDSLAILAFVTQRDWQAPDAWFCDELIAAAMVAAGLLPQKTAIPVSRITVRDLFLLASTLAEAA